MLYLLIGLIDVAALMIIELEIGIRAQRDAELEAEVARHHLTALRREPSRLGGRIRKFTRTVNGQIEAGIPRANRTTLLLLLRLFHTPTLIAVTDYAGFRTWCR